MMGKFVHAAAVLLLAALAGTWPALGGVLSSGATGTTVVGTFRLGPTGIYCIKAPCPWRGIVKLGPDGRPDGRPLWSGDDLPPIRATPIDRKRILAVWRKSGCIILDGEFREGALFVSRISGSC